MAQRTSQGLKEGNKQSREKVVSLKANSKGLLKRDRGRKKSQRFFKCIVEMGRGMGSSSGGENTIH